MKEELQKLGMTKSEAIVFELLVKYGEISGSQLAKKSGIDRSTTYNLLDSLNKKGFVSYVIKNGLKTYQLSNPENLKKFAEEKVQIANSLIEEIKKILKKEHQEEIVEIYEGKNAPRVMYNLYVNQKNQKFLTYGGYGKMFSTLEPEMKGYIKKFKENKNSLYAFISKDYPNKEKLNVITKNIQQTKFNSIPGGFTVSSDSVIFHIYDDESKVILIKNKTVANLMREIYEIAWDKESVKEVKM